MASERERLDWLERTYGEDGPGMLGIGDDGAYLALSSPHLVVSVDAAIEGVHFRRAWLDWEAVAFRAVQAALSDLAAMGAAPAAVLSSASLPATFSEAAFAALARGTARSADSHGARLIGGNLSASPHVEVHTTVIGHVPGPDALLTRRGAKPGDTLWVTGPLGAAALGLGVLEHLLPSPRADVAQDPGLTESQSISQLDALLASSRIPERFWSLANACVKRWRAPQARIEAGLALRHHATAAIDLSDGLSADAHTLARASGLTLVIDEPLPSLTYAPKVDAAAPSTSSDFCAALASELGVDWPSLQAHGGEDYELLFTLPRAVEPPCPAFRIGHCKAGPTVVRFTDPRLNPPIPSGFDHFRR